MLEKKCRSASYLVNLPPQITLSPAIKENHTVDINSNAKKMSFLFVFTIVWLYTFCIFYKLSVRSYIW